jgi:hypothetical protein
VVHQELLAQQIQAVEVVVRVIALKTLAAQVVQAS